MLVNMHTLCIAVYTIEPLLKNLSLKTLLRYFEYPSSNTADVPDRTLYIAAKTLSYALFHLCFGQNS